MPATPAGGNQVTMTYGSYNFSPVPLITIDKEYQRAGDGSLLGTQFTVTANGYVTPIATGIGGYKNVDTYQDDLRTAVATDGQRFLIQCQGNTILDCYPKIISLNFQEGSDNWVFTTPYTLTIQFNDEPTNSGENSGTMPPYIQEADESWEIEFVQDNSKFLLDLSLA